MALRNSLIKAKLKVAEHKATSGGAGLGGFETQAEKDAFLDLYAGGSVAQCISDCDTAYSGSPRVQEFTPGSMSTIEKEATGVDEINPGLFLTYSHSSSYVVHEGEAGNTIFAEGTLYWMPCTGGNTADFENFKKLLERHMAYSYIDYADNSTATEISNALGDYNTFKGTL